MPAMLVSAHAQAHPPVSPEQAARMRERMLPAWQAATGVCRGLHALMLGLPPELEQLASPLPHHLRLQARADRADRLDGSWQGSLLHWPLRPGRLDAVLMRLDACWLPWLPDLVRVATEALGPQGRLVICVQGRAVLEPWCQVGMPLAHLHGMTLLTAAWGDRRLFTRLPARWRYQWHAGWQQWLGFADWSVQLWQKQVTEPLMPGRRTTRQSPRWTGIWLPQSRQPLICPRKDCP